MENPISTPEETPFVIAEISGNHNGSLQRGLDIISAAAKVGVNAVKIQTYTADTITMNVDSPEFRISESHKLWGNRNLYSLYQEASTPWEWHDEIFSHARKCGVIPFSTPFDESAVDFLEELECPIYKIASLEIVDLPLIEYTASTGKPLIISTGTATLDEVSDAVKSAREGGCGDLTLLVCTSSYPALAKDAHLARLQTLKRMFNVKVGLSDHTMGNTVAIAATAIGASVLEKHVTLSRNDGGVDSAFSMEPHELEIYIGECRNAFTSIGDGNHWRSESESESVRLRPSLRFTKDMKAGEVITSEHFRSVRPSGGLPPSKAKMIIGKKLIKSVSLGDPVVFSDFE